MPEHGLDAVLVAVELALEAERPSAEQCRAAESGCASIRASNWSTRWGPRSCAKSGLLAHRLQLVDMVILDELGYLAFSQAGERCYSTCWAGCTSTHFSTPGSSARCVEWMPLSTLA
jgi:hypothetical protein